MPIGYDCEFTDFAACVAAQKKNGHSEEEAKRICGAIQRDTEASCARKVIESKLAADEELHEVKRVKAHVLCCTECGANVRCADWCHTRGITKVEDGWVALVSTPMAHDMAKSEHYSVRFDLALQRLGDDRA